MRGSRVEGTTQVSVQGSVVSREVPALRTCSTASLAPTVPGPHLSCSDSKDAGSIPNALSSSPHVTEPPP